MVMGAGKLGEAVLDLRADHKGLERDLDTAKRKTDKSFKGMVGSAKSMRAGLLSGLAAGGATALVMKGIDAASDLQESLNKTTATFGKSAKLMPGYGKSVADALGMSRQQALDAAAGIGSMLIPMGVSQEEAAKMSSRMTTLAADLGSFHNADPTEMLDRLRAGLSGESEPLKRFGIVLNETRVAQEAVRMGIAKTGDTLTDGQKIQARYSLALRDAGAANGDFARTSGGLANQQRILKAEVGDLAASLGSVLLPAATKGVGALRAVVGFISDHQETIKAAAAAVRDGLAKAWEYAQKAFEAARPTFENLVETIRSVVDTIQGLWDRFGQRILSVLREVWGVVSTYVETQLKVLRDVVNVVLALLRGDWGDAWDALKALVRDALEGAATIAKKILTGLVPALVKLAGSAGVALAGALLRAAGNGLKGLASTILNGVASAISGIASGVAAIAQAIGSAIASGIVSGLRAMGGWLKDQLTALVVELIPGPIRKVLHIGSPSKLMAKEVGEPIGQGIEEGTRHALERAKAPIGAALSAVVLAAVRDAHENLRGLAGSLASAAGEVVDARLASRLDYLDEEKGPEAANLRAMRAARDAAQTADERGRLQAGISDAAAEFARGGTPAEQEEARKKLAEAHKALADWEADQAIAAEERRLAGLRDVAEQEERDRKENIDRRMADLTESFLQGEIKQKAYAEGISRILREEGASVEAAGDYLGQAFAGSFVRARDAALAQSVRLGDVAGIKPGGPDVQDPFAVRVEEWRKRDAALEKALAAIDKRRPEEGAGKAAWTAWSKERIRAKDLLDAHRAARPKRLGAGGILSAPTYGLLAERGYAEAAVPLDGSSRSWSLLDRAASLMPARGAGPEPPAGPLVTVQRMEVRGQDDIAVLAARLSRYLVTQGVRP